MTKLLRTAVALLFVGLAGICNAQMLAPSFSSGSITLLQPEWEISQRIGGEAEPLAAYIKGIVAAAEEVVHAHAAGNPTSGVIVVAVRTNHRSRVWIEFGENPSPASLASAMATRIEAVAPPRVSTGTISFHINFDLWGGGKPLTNSERPVFAPAQWREAAGKLGGVADTEAILDSLWPDKG
jgi:hypothetical protein